MDEEDAGMVTTTVWPGVTLVTTDAEVVYVVVEDDVDDDAAAVVEEPAVVLELELESLP